MGPSHGQVLLMSTATHLPSQVHVLETAVHYDGHETRKEPRTYYRGTAVGCIMHCATVAVPMAVAAAAKHIFLTQARLKSTLVDAV